MLVMEKATRDGTVKGKRTARSRADRPEGLSRYVIARRTNGAIELLHSTSLSGGEALPVFTVEQAAWRYLRSVTGAEWYVRKSIDGELVSMLMCLYRETEGVLLNPDPADFATGRSEVLVDRESYLNACVYAGTYDPPLPGTRRSVGDVLTASRGG